MRRTRLQLSQAGVAAAALLLIPAVARAQEVETDVEADVETEASAPQLASGLRLALRLEPGVALAMTDPQSDLTDAGFAQTIKLMVGVTRYLELGPSVSFTTLPGNGDMAESGRAWTAGGGARVMRPHDAGRGSFSAISPWVDADALYVRTGDLHRPGFALGAGASLPIDQRRRFWIGPYVRYFQIMQGDRTGFDNRDAQILSVGLSLEVGSGLEQERRPLIVAEETAEVEVVAAAPIVDRDGDGVADGADNCPDVAGLADNAGCPPYEKVAVLPDKLEVKDKIAFEWNSSKLDASSGPALDEVAQALKDNPTFRVEVAGHASSDGNDDHNQQLSEQRAETVVTYLVSRGVARDRLKSRGFSSSVPAETNTTSAGRVSNRRVEFSVHLILVNDGNTP
jgi:outer membrane protein OmpA-like peptidoglycan-associated protein